MKNLPLLLLTLLGSAAIIILVAILFSKSGTRTSPESTVESAVLERGVLHQLGPTQAPVTIVEFSDLQCPSCRAAQAIVNQVMTQYPEQVRLLYHHYLLPQFANSRLAAQATLAAERLGRFQDYQNLIFDRQSEWAAITDQEQLSQTFLTYAGELGLDKTKFSETMVSEEVAKAILADTQLGRELGLTGTPSFFVNGRQISAPQLLSVVQSLVSTSSAQPN